MLFTLAHHVGAVKPGTHPIRKDAVVEDAKPQRLRHEPAARALAVGDIAFADRLYGDHRDDLIWVPERGFFTWDGSRYSHDRTGRVLTFCEETTRRILIEAVEAPRREAEALLSQASEYSRDRRVRGALEFLKPRIAVRIDELDANPGLFAVVNGTIDLRTTQLRPHDRRDRITRIAPIVYEPDARAPRWYEFLAEIFPDGLDNGLTAYVQRLVGYALTAEQTEHTLPILVGKGSNGKTTLIKKLLAVAGDYGQAAPASLLMKKYGDAIPTDVARLAGCRVVVVSETPEDGRLDEERVKLLTGGEGRIAARFLRRDFFEFKPTHHLFLQTNHKPRISGTDFAIWRRIRLIPFNVKFEDSQENPDTEHPRDPSLDDELTRELPGILNWALEGARLWYENGLNEPEVVRDATKEYREEQDVLADFVNDCCIVGPERRTTVADIYNSYRSWCEREGTRPWTKNRFARRLTDAGFGSPPRELGQRVKSGIALKYEEESHGSHN